MLKFLATIFLLFGIFSLGLALYYGKKIGIIKVFNEVKDLEQKDECRENLTDEYGYEDEIYEDVSSEDLRNARMDESENLSQKNVLAPVNKIRNEERSNQEKEPEKTSIMENTIKDSENETSFMDAETSFMDNQVIPKSEIVNDESTSFMDNSAAEEETSFMTDASSLNLNQNAEDEATSFMQENCSDLDEETSFMTNTSEKRGISSKEGNDDEETSFMDLKISIGSVEPPNISEDEETSFM